MKESKKAEAIPNETVLPKERKEMVEYRPGEPGNDCISCLSFEEPESCNKVQGMIYRSGTCNSWQPETNSDPMLEGLDQDGIEDMLFGELEDE